MKTTLLFVLLLIVTSSAFAIEPIVRADGSVLLSRPAGASIESRTAMVSGSSSAFFKDFSKKFGDCSIVIDKNSGNAKAILCNPIAIADQNAGRDEIRLAADKFLAENQSLLNIDFKNLRFAAADKFGGTWYVFYKQYLDGYKIEYSNITLRITNGSTGMITMNYYPSANISEAQGVAGSPRPDYEKSATFGLKYPTEKIQMVQSIYKAKIVPTETATGTVFRKVLVIPVRIKNSLQSYTSYVAVDNGDLLSRRNELLSERTVSVSGTVRMENPTIPAVKVPFQDIGITSTGAPAYTDLQGNATLPTSYSGTMDLMMNGLKTSISYMNSEYDYETPSKTVQVQSIGNQNISIGDDMADLGTRTVFYHANYFVDFVKALDPACPGLDKTMPIEIQNYYDEQYGANAFYSPRDDKIAFTCVSNNQYAFTECPDVLYHEYGHAVNNYIYKMVYEDGLTNATVNESFADIMASCITDNSILGLGHDRQDPSNEIRNCKNTRKYPQDMIEESHNDSMILTGAFWDLREMKDIDYYRNLSHKVRYARVDGIDAGDCFMRIFLETLYADDNDGNILNGTPNMPLIVKAFNDHNIGTSLFVSTKISHAKLPSTSDTLNAYKTTLNVAPGSFVGLPIQIESVNINYYTNWNKNICRIASTKIGDNYSALIPAQRPGTLVYYWFQVITSVDTVYYYEYKESSKPYTFMVGYTKVYDEPMDMNQWTLGLPYEYKANDISWEYAVPEEISFIYDGIDFNMQPRGGANGSSDKCLVTGAYSADGPMDVQKFPAGTITAESPNYALNTYKHPVLSLDYWFKAKRFYPDLYTSQPPEFWISASSDGYGWETVHSAYRDTTAGWNNMLIDLSKYGQNVKFRFALRSGGMVYSNSELYLLFVLTKCLIDNIAIYDSKYEYNPASEDLQNNDFVTVSPQPAENYVNFSFPANTSYRLRISNLYGEQVYMAENAASGATREQFVWDRTCSNGNQAMPGIYFYEIFTGSECLKGKFVLSGK